MAEHTKWAHLAKPRSATAQCAYDDEKPVSDFRTLVYRLRTGASLTQAALAKRMSTTQSAVARMEAGGTQPTLTTLRRVAEAVGQDLVVVVGPDAARNPTLAGLERDGHVVLR